MNQRHSFHYAGAAVSAPAQGDSSLNNTIVATYLHSQVSIARTDPGQDSTLRAPSAVGSTGNPGGSIEARGTQSQQLTKNLYRLNKNCYFAERYQKDLIVLHFTAGTSSESALRTWSANPQRIATAYGVDPDGMIHEFFPPECWAYHLGVRGTHAHDRRSIGIEIANVGPLKLDGASRSQLNWWPKNWGTRFCLVEEKHRFIERAYRGMNYFAVMPPDQQEAVGTLVRNLCQQFSIPREASAAARTGEYAPQEFSRYRGIASHSNFRADKWDVGPAFDWDNLGV